MEAALMDDFERTAALVTKLRGIVEAEPIGPDHVPRWLPAWAAASTQRHEEIAYTPEGRARWLNLVTSHAAMLARPRSPVIGVGP